MANQAETNDFFTGIAEEGKDELVDELDELMADAEEEEVRR